MEMLLAQGMDYRLAYHIASLFVRAPIPAYERELQFPSTSHCMSSERKKEESDDEKDQEESKSESTDNTNSSPVDRQGVSTGWWTKCPPMDGHSHFENL